MAVMSMSLLHLALSCKDTASASWPLKDLRLKTITHQWREYASVDVETPVRTVGGTLFVGSKSHCKYFFIAIKNTFWHRISKYALLFSACGSNGYRQTFEIRIPSFDLGDSTGSACRALTFGETPTKRKHRWHRNTSKPATPHVYVRCKKHLLETHKKGITTHQYQ